MHKRDSGITLIELLIALAVISIAFMAFAFSQLQSLRATSRAQLLTEVKAAANQALETVSTEVLAAVTVTDCSTDPLCDQKDEVGGVPRNLSFKFIDYYHYCAPLAWDDGLRTSYRTQVSSLPVSSDKVGPCSGSTTLGDVAVSWLVSSPAPGLPEEGVLDITVTATHPQGQSLTIGNTITCYDVYPAPKKETPRPCPTPELP